MATRLTPVGWADTDSVKFAYPENLRSGARIRGMSPIQIDLLSILCLNTQIFVTMAHKVGQGQV